MPQLLFQSKWFCSDIDLLEGDLVYFVKEDTALTSKWTIRLVDSVLKGRDGTIREVTVKYCNSGEQSLSLAGNSCKDMTLPQ